MRVIMGADSKGFELKEHVKAHLHGLGYEVVDKTPKPGLNFLESTVMVVKALLQQEGDRGIVFDEYGAGSFMVANKHKGMICAQVSDEHSARMTREHNNTSLITIGSGIVGKKLAERICEAFLCAEYSGGRHQIRVDMLNKMA